MNGLLVETSEEGFSFGLAGAEMAGDGLGLLAVVAHGPDANPVAVLAGELDDGGVRILVEQVFLELDGTIF